MRIIARLDIKNSNLIKGINFEGLRIVGNPNKHAVEYYKKGVDEIIFMDVVASLYGRNNLTDIINSATKDIFIPITVGGGVRSIKDAEKIFLAGADKIAINTAAVKNPNLIEDLSKKFGSQSIVLSVEAKKKDKGNWEVYTENGRQETGLDVIKWTKIATEKGVGEILLTSVDMEGTKKGFDFDLIKKVSNNVNVPIIASGGFGKPNDMLKAHLDCSADAVAIADAFHFKRVKIEDLRRIAFDNNFNLRK
tara:strand:+ start:307 stop:1056 length:750 start_codon:yes stop_codon:yes gene_type:complete